MTQRKLESGRAGLEDFKDSPIELGKGKLDSGRAVLADFKDSPIELGNRY
jgi:hypothetical protein